MKDCHDLFKLEVIDLESFEYLLGSLGKPTVFVDGVDERERTP